MPRYNLQDLMKLQEELSASIYSDVFITIDNKDYLIPTPNLEMFIEDIIISLENGDIPNA